MNQGVTLAALLPLCTLLPVIVVRGSKGVTQAAVMTTPPDRPFTLNSDLYYSFFVYNAPADLAVQTKLFRDGKMASGGSSRSSSDCRGETR